MRKPSSPLLISIVSALLVVGAYGCGGDSPTFVEPGTDDTGSTDETNTDTSGSETTPTDGTSETTPPPADDGIDTTPPPDGTPTDGVVPPTDGIVPPVDSGVSDAILPDGGIVCTEPGAKVYGGHCYFRIETPRSFGAQQTACAATIGKTHLVSITSAGEQTFIEANFLGGFGGDRWIGLARKPTDPSTKASFVWVTGEAATYDHWATGEPNGSGPCARMVNGIGGPGPSGTWGDRGCDTMQQAICERE